MNILLAVTGGIAVYKAVDLANNLKKIGYEVKVVMTKNATKFVTELTFQSITKNFVYTDTFFELNEKEIQHIDLIKWADKIILAPATANCISKIANGIADDLVSTLFLANNKFSDTYIAPAMNTNMYLNPVIQKNLNTLENLGINIIEPEEGLLACGDVGKGKFADVFKIIDEVMMTKKLLDGKNILVTAGATKEYIDPVRFLSNPASGKMGIAIAEESAKLGANVTLITSADYKTENKNINVIKIVSAEDMFLEVEKIYKNFDFIVKSSAVSDYKPKIVHKYKVKKSTADEVIELERTVDILKYIGERKKENQIIIGFAAETNNVINYAKDKIKRKNLDYIVANDVSKSDIGFSSNDNEVYIIDKNFNTEKLEKNTKSNIAKKIIDKCIIGNL